MSYWVVNNDELYHHGVKGQKWGVRRYQNPDGTLTEEGKKRYGTVENFNKAQRRKKIAIGVSAGVGGTLAIGAAVILGKQYLTNRKLIESHDRAIENLDQDISDDKEMIKYYVDELDKAEKDLKNIKEENKNIDKIREEAKRHEKLAVKEWMPDPESASRYYGVREWVNHPSNPDNPNRGRMAKATYNYYKEDAKSHDALMRADRMQRKEDRAESRRLDASINVNDYTNKLKNDRRDKRDYEDARNYFKKHPLATKLPKTQFTRKQLSEMGIDYVEPDYNEPDYVKPDYVKPDYIEPDFIEKFYKKNSKK